MIIFKQEGVPEVPRRDDQAPGRLDRQQLGGHPMDAAAHGAGVGTSPIVLIVHLRHQRI